MKYCIASLLLAWTAWISGQGCSTNWIYESELLGGETEIVDWTGGGTLTSVSFFIEWENSDGDASMASDLIWTITSPGGQCWSVGGTMCSGTANWPGSWNTSETNAVSATFAVNASLTGSGTWSIAMENGMASSAGAVYVMDVNLTGICPDGGGATDILGCMDVNACNYDPLATLEDGSCLTNDVCGICGGDGSFCAEVLGCMYDWACNFDPAATLDDGSCEVLSCSPIEIPGCTYAEASNFNPSATDDDGTCTGFNGTTPNNCPSDLTGDGVINTADLLDFLGVFGSVCP